MTCKVAQLSATPLLFCSTFQMASSRGKAVAYSTLHELDMIQASNLLLLLAMHVPMRREVVALNLQIGVGVHVAGGIAQLPHAVKPGRRICTGQAPKRHAQVSGKHAWPQIRKLVRCRSEVPASSGHFGWDKWGQKLLHKTGHYHARICAGIKPNAAVALWDDDTACYKGQRLRNSSKAACCLRSHLSFPWERRPC